MKQKILPLIALLVSGSLSAQTSFNPTKDAHIKASSSSSNFDNTTLEVKHLEDVGSSRKAYVGFDLSSLTQSVADATFTLTIAPITGTWNPNTENDDDADGFGTEFFFNVYGITESTELGWGESAITWNDAPANVTSSGNAVESSDTSFLGSFSIDGDGNDGDTVSVTGSSLVNYLNSAGDTSPSFIIVRETAPDDPNTNTLIHHFYSSEAGSGMPELSITTVPEPSAFALLAGFAGLTYVMVRRRTN